MNFVLAELVAGFQVTTTSLITISLESISAPVLRATILFENIEMTKAHLIRFCKILMKTGFCLNFPCVSVLTSSQGIRLRRPICSSLFRDGWRLPFRFVVQQ
jgi:hypothetical protein